MQTFLRAIGVLALVYLGVTSSAQADTLFASYTVTVSSAGGVASGCSSAVGGTGTFNTYTSGAVLFEAPSSSLTGCYAGGFTGVPTPFTPDGTPTTYIGIGGAHPDGTPAQLNALATNWYAEFGDLCGGAGQCTGSSTTTNDNNSGDIEVLINSGNASQDFQIYSASGTLDGIANFPSATSQCSVNTNTNTITVAAQTICFEDLSTGGSIVMSIGAPSVPEPSSVAFVGLGVLGAAEFFRRRRKARAA